MLVKEKFRGERGEDEAKGSQRPDEADIAPRHEKEKRSEKSRLEGHSDKNIAVGDPIDDQTGDFRETDVRNFPNLFETLAEEDNANGFENQADEKDGDELGHVRGLNSELV